MEEQEVAKLFHILSQEVQKSEESLKCDALVKIVVVIEQLGLEDAGLRFTLQEQI